MREWGESITILRFQDPPEVQVDAYQTVKEVAPSRTQRSLTWNGGTTTPQLMWEQNCLPSKGSSLRRCYKSTTPLLNDKPGQTSLIEHCILVTDHRPIRQAPYRIPVACREQVETEISEMLRHRVIEPTISPWASPIIMVPKKDNTVRICVDYRRLNACYKKGCLPAT